MYSSHSDHKAAMVERVNRTIREKLVRAIELRGEKWIDLITKVVHAYNNQYHRTIKMTPAEAERNFGLATFNTLEVRIITGRKFKRRKRAEFVVGDIVRLKITPGEFRKGALKTFTNEVFRVVSVKTTKYKFVYSVETVRDGEKIFGKFDGDMLNHAVDEAEHRLRVIDERVHRGVRQLLVHWDGYDAGADEWLNAADVFDI